MTPGRKSNALLLLDLATNPLHAEILKEAPRITLAIAVTAAAMRLPRHWLSRNRRGMGVSLLPGMLLMTLAGAMVGAVTLGLPLLPCLALGAAVAPTAPVLSAPILTGRLAQRAVPDELRHAMTAESGINDGLGLPLVMLPILLMRHGPAQAAGDWLVHVLGWEIGGAVLVGAPAGWLTSQCMAWSSNRPASEKASLLTVTISLALATTAGVRLLGGDEILAAIVSGAVLNNTNPRFEVQKHHERFTEALGRLFDLPVMILFGAANFWAAWGSLGWAWLGFAAGILLLRRVPAWLLLGRLVTWTRSVRSALFAGWFGPIGAAALFYAMMIQDETGSAALWPAISLAIGGSVLAHGVTETPFTRMFGGEPLTGQPVGGKANAAEEEASTG